MHVLQVVLYTRPIGGLEIYGRDIGRAFTSLGHDLEVWSVLENIPVHEGWGEIPIRALAPGNSLSYSIYYRYWRRFLEWQLRRRKHDFDLVLMMHPFTVTSAYRAQLENYWIWTYGVDVWDDWPKGYHEALTSAQQIIAISTHTRQEVIKRLPHKDVAVIHPIIDIERFTPLPANQNEDRPYRLLTVARLVAEERSKGHDIVIRNLATMQNRLSRPVEYWIAGTGPDYARLEDLATEHNVADCIRFLGRVSDEELVGAYQACDVFVMPSLREGFGIVYLEASACEKPVVGSNIGGAVDAIEDMATGFCINPTSDSELVEAILAILNDPQLARRMGKDGRARVVEHFSPHALQMKLKQIMLGSSESNG